MFFVVERTIVFIGVSMQATVYAATPTRKSYKYENGKVYKINQKPTEMKNKPITPTLTLHFAHFVFFFFSVFDVSELVSFVLLVAFGESVLESIFN